MRRGAAIAVVVAVAILGGISGCTKRPTPGGPTTTTQPSLPFDSSPSRSRLEQLTGLRFPTSTTTYRSVRAAEGELDVTFQMDPADVESFVADSKLPAPRAERLIAHPSPVWSLDPGGDVRSTSTTRDGLRIAAEIVTVPGPLATVRLVVASGG